MDLIKRMAGGGVLGAFVAWGTILVIETVNNFLAWYDALDISEIHSEQIGFVGVATVIGAFLGIVSWCNE